jgi:undecaprenyl diphosphate synthase
MDGNARGLPRAEGHWAGAESVREAVETCRQIGVVFLTLYAFSSENWNRQKKEVDTIDEAAQALPT